MENNSGKISIINSVPTEDSATPLSAVTLRSIEDAGTLAVQVVGTYTGALTIQARVKGSTTWVSLAGVAVRNAATGAGTSTIPSAAPGLYIVDVSAYNDVRVTALSAMTGEAAIAMSAMPGTSNISLGSPLPAGGNTIGSVSLGTAGTGAGNIGKAEDAVAASGDTGIFQLGVRRDAPTISASAAGDYNELATTRHGALYTQAVDGMKRTYSAGFKLTPALGTVLEVIGAASTTVEINRITFTLFGTAAGKVDILINKRSAASTVGTTITAPAKVPYDAADAAAVATVKGFTAAPTNGTLVGLLRQAMIYCGAGVPSDRIKIESGGYAKSITLTSATQAITVELAGTIPTGAELAVDVEWTEF